jgi:hypothetical protein
VLLLSGRYFLHHAAFSDGGDFLCGHDGATETNKSIADIGARFKPLPDEALSPLDRLRGEESTLFHGIAPNGSPAVVHRITDLRSTRIRPEPNLVGLRGLNKTTTVVAIDHSECFGAIEWEDETDLNVPSFMKLKASISASAFHSVSPAGKAPTKINTLRLIPLPPFLLPCIASHSHSSFKQLGFGCLREVVDSEIILKRGGGQPMPPPIVRRSSSTCVGPPNPGKRKTRLAGPRPRSSTPSPASPNGKIA